jgi:hypothetical protein
MRGVAAAVLAMYAGACTPRRGAVATMVVGASVTVYGAYVASSDTSGGDDHPWCPAFPVGDGATCRERGVEVMAVGVVIAGLGVLLYLREYLESR